MNDNVTKTEFGYEVLWANTEHYSSRILVFDHIGSKTNMSFTKETTKSLVSRLLSQVIRKYIT